jgi:hypothetical protein
MFGVLPYMITLASAEFDVSLRIEVHLIINPVSLIHWVIGLLGAPNSEYTAFFWGGQCFDRFFGPKRRGSPGPSWFGHR